MNSDNVTYIREKREPDLRSSDRLKAIHQDHANLDDLSAASGSPDEWLGTAISHLKVQTSDAVQTGSGTTTVSVAALHLVMMHLEALEMGGAAWKGNAR